MTPHAARNLACKGFKTLGLRTWQAQRFAKNDVRLEITALSGAHAPSVVKYRRRRREEAVQGAGILGPFHAQGAAESDASVRLGVRSHVPGRTGDWAQGEEAGIGNAKP